MITPDFLRQLGVLLSLPLMLIAAGGAITIPITRDWRLALFAYAMMSTALAILFTGFLPLEWALLHAVIGGLIALMLFVSARQVRVGTPPSADREARWPQLSSLWVFRVLVSLVMLIAFLAIRERVNLPVPNTLIRDGMLWLALAGCLGLALHEEPLHAGLALLTLLNAALLLLFVLLQSRVLVGMLATWQLVLGVAISYLTVARGLAPPAPPVEPRSGRWQR